MIRRYMLPFLAVLLILSVITGSAVVALAKNPEQMGDPLSGRVLQQTELSGSEGYYTGKVANDRFPGPASLGNIPMQAKGFMGAYEASAHYPLPDQEGVAFVLNIAYQYEYQNQAEAALDELSYFLGQQKLPANAKEEPVEHLVSLAATHNMGGRAMRFTYLSEGITSETSYFWVVNDNILVLLMVDGPSTPSTEKIFDTVGTTIVQR